MATWCIWFTGLSGSGKTTLSRLVHEEFKMRRIPTEHLDGDILRASLCRDLGFTREDREANVRRLGLISHRLTRNGVTSLVAAIAPYALNREQNRKLIGNYIEVFCRCSLDVLIARDPKGLYRRALAGDLPHFTGLSAPYESPVAPEIEVRTDLESVDQSMAKILGSLQAQGVIPERTQDRPPRRNEPTAGDVSHGLSDGALPEKLYAAPASFEG